MAISPGKESFVGKIVLQNYAEQIVESFRIQITGFYNFIYGLNPFYMNNDH